MDSSIRHLHCDYLKFHEVKVCKTSPRICEANRRVNLEICGWWECFLLILRRIFKIAGCCSISDSYKGGGGGMIILVE